jgi:hypothetical protein
LNHTIHVACVALGALLLLALIAFDARGSAGEQHHDVRDKVRRRAFRTCAGLACLGLLLSSYFTKGHIIPGDGHSHLARTFLTLDALQGGELPVWSNRWYLGFPFDLHYGPLYYLLSALVVALCGSKLYFGSKLLLWTLHLAGAATAYVLGVQRYRDRRAATVLCVGYTLAGYHLDALRTDGKLPMSLLFVATPLLFALIEHLRREPGFRVRASLFAALLLALCFATHAQYGSYLTAGYLASTTIEGIFAPGQRRILLLRHVLEAGAVAFVLSAWLLVPTLLETRYLALSMSAASASWGGFNLQGLLQHLQLMVTPLPERAKFLPGYLGVALVALALLGLLLPARARQGQGGEVRSKAWYPLALVLFGLPWPGFGQLRSDLLIFVGVAVLAADGYCALSQRLRFRCLPALVCLLIVLDSGEGLVKADYPRNDPAPYVAARKALRASGVPGRVLSLYGHKGTFWPTMEVVSAGISTPLGGVPQLATRSIGYTLAIVTQVAREVIDQRLPLSPGSLDLLHLIGVRYLLAGKKHRRIEARRLPPVTFATQLRRVQPIPELERLEVATAGEALKSREIPADSVLALAQQMGLSATAPLAQRLLVMDDALHASALRASDLEPIETIQFRVSQLVEQHTRVSFRYGADRPGFLRLAYAHAPFGKVEIDGRSVPFSRDAFGSIVVFAPPGSHQLAWKVGISPLRAWLLAVSALAAMGVLAWFLLERRRHS